MASMFKELQNSKDQNKEDISDDESNDENESIDLLEKVSWKKLEKNIQTAKTSININHLRFNNEGRIKNTFVIMNLDLCAHWK